MTRERQKDVLESIGLIAVIASLIFVGIETRNGAIQAELNTEALEMTAYQQMIDSINQMNARADCTILFQTANRSPVRRKC